MTSKFKVAPRVAARANRFRAFSRRLRAATADAALSRLARFYRARLAVVTAERDGADQTITALMHDLARADLRIADLERELAALRDGRLSQYGESRA